MTSAFWQPPEHGLRRWYAVLSGIAWWMLHLTAEAALAHQACLHPNVTWIMHAVTLVTALGTGLAMFWSWRMFTGSSAPDTGEPATDPTRFLGLFGFAVGAISLLLIVWEGSYVVAINACTVA